MIAASSLSAAVFRYAVTADADAESSPDVGSSSMSSLGLFANETATESRRRWPPESPLKSAFPALISAHDSKPIDSSSCVSIAAFSAAPICGWYSSMAVRMCSRQLRNAQSTSCCVT